MKPFYLLCILFSAYLNPYKCIAQIKNDNTTISKNVALHYIKEVLNNKNLKAIDSIFAQDYVFHEMNGGILWSTATWQ